MEWVAPGDPWLDPLADWAYFRGLCGSLRCVGVPPAQSELVASAAASAGHP
jgi:hypothetical protein